MSTETKASHQHPEDIDLFLLIERSILFFKRFKWVFGIAILAGLAFGFLNWKRLPKVYRSRLILHSYTLSNLDQMQVIDNWNSLLKRRERHSLSVELECDEAMLGKVKQIKAKEIQKVFTASNPNGFYIDVLVTDNAVLPSLQKAILSGLEHSEFISKQLRLRRANMTEMIRQVEIEISKLDSTKRKVESLVRSGEARSSSMMIDISGMNSQLIGLNEKLLGYKYDLQFLGAVQVLQGFSEFTQPVGPNLYVWIAIGLLSFLVIAYFIALLRSISDKMKARSRLSQ